MSLRETIEEKVATYISSGGELKRGNPKQCLLAVCGRKVRGDYMKAAMTELGITVEAAGALEAGFEGWEGLSKTLQPDAWKIGADIAAKYKVAKEEPQDLPDEED